MLESEQDIGELTRKMMKEDIPVLAADLDKTDISDLFERILNHDAVGSQHSLLLFRLVSYCVGKKAGHRCRLSPDQDHQSDQHSVRDASPWHQHAPHWPPPTACTESTLALRSPLRGCFTLHQASNAAEDEVRLRQGESNTMMK